jgi:hypothetical protein
MTRALSTALLAGALLAGCGGDLPSPGVTIQQGDRHDNVLRHIGFEGDRISISLPGGQQAEITATGALSIGGKPVALDDPQRVLVQRFHEHAIALRNEGLAMGTAGAKMAGHAVSSVVAGLAQGEPDSIGQRIEAEAATLESRALQLCERAMALQAAQVELAKAVPAFKPYPVTTRIDVNACR